MACVRRKKGFQRVVFAIPHPSGKAAIVKIPQAREEFYIVFLWTLEKGWKCRTPQVEGIGAYLDELVRISIRLDERAPGALVDAVIYDGVRTNWDSSNWSENDLVWSRDPDNIVYVW